MVVASSAHSAGRNLDHPDFYPFFKTAEQLNVSVCVHVGSGRPAAAAERFSNPFFVHATTHPFEQVIGVMCIVAGGIFEWFPKLKVAFLEAGGGWVPYWMERLDEHYEYLQPEVPWLKMPPSEYIRKRDVYFSFEPDERTLPFVMDFIGDDRLLFASDYNHSDCKFPSTVEAVTQRGEILESTLAKLMGKKASRLYSLLLVNRRSSLCELLMQTDMSRKNSFLGRNFFRNPTGLSPRRSSKTIRVQALWWWKGNCGPNPWARYPHYPFY